MSLSRDPWRLAGPAVLLLAVVAVVVLVTKVDAGGAGRAKARAMSASGAAAMTDSVVGDAVVRAGEMKPGSSVAGTVKVENSGDAAGAFRLAQVDVLDTPGAGGGRLSTKLRMTIEDAHGGRRLYRGVLGAMKDRPLGYLGAGDEREYRFTLAYPRGGTDGAFTGSRVETTFDWTATTGEPPPVRDTRPPTVLVDAQRFDGRTVVLALTCGERCEVVGLSSGAWAASPEPLEAGRPALRTVVLSPAQAGALEGLRARSGAAALPIQVTLADAAGNRATARAAVRAER